MADSKRPLGKRLPRDFAGSLELKGGTGGITAFCSCEDFLEVYKEDRTFRVQSPESIDPDRTNPNAPFVAMVAEDTIGSSSPIVARVLLQGQAIVEAAVFETQVDKKAVIRVLYRIKESLVACQKAARRVAPAVDGIVDNIRTQGVARDNRGRALNPLPQVPDLDAEATSFLINAKRAVTDICRLAPLFLPVNGKDNNFDHLEKRLAKAVGPSASVTEFVRAHANGIRYLINLRNGQEHPEPDRRTFIDNFRVTPDGAIAVPMWYSSGETPRPIHDEMPGAIDFLVQIAEWMLIELVMATVSKHYPFVIEEVDDVRLDPKKPIKYRLSVDFQKLKQHESVPE